MRKISEIEADWDNAVSAIELCHSIDAFDAVDNSPIANAPTDVRDLLDWVKRTRSKIRNFLNHDSLSYRPEKQIKDLEQLLNEVEE